MRGDAIDVDVCLVYRSLEEQQEPKIDPHEIWNESNRETVGGVVDHSSIDDNVVYFNGQEGGYFAIPLETAVKIAPSSPSLIDSSVVLFPLDFWTPDTNHLQQDDKDSLLVIDVQNFSEKGNGVGEDPFITRDSFSLLPVSNDARNSSIKGLYTFEEIGEEWERNMEPGGSMRDLFAKEDVLLSHPSLVRHTHTYISTHIHTHTHQIQSHSSHSNDRLLLSHWI